MLGCCIVFAMWGQAGSVTATLFTAPLPFVIGALCYTHRAEDPSTMQCIFEDALLGIRSGAIGGVVGLFVILEVMLAVWCWGNCSPALPIFVMLTPIALLFSIFVGIYPGFVAGLAVGMLWGMARYLTHRSRPALAATPANASLPEISRASGC